MLTKRSLERKAFGIAIFLTIVVALLSLLSISGWSVGLGLNKVENSDKFGHIVAYFTLSLSWLYALKFEHRPMRHKIIFVIILIGYGIILEALQESITTYRTGDYRDVIANSVGVLLAIISFKRLSYWLNSMLK